MAEKQTSRSLTRPLTPRLTPVNGPSVIPARSTGQPRPSTKRAPVPRPVSLNTGYINVLLRIGGPLLESIDASLLLLLEADYTERCRATTLTSDQVKQAHLIAKDKGVKWANDWIKEQQNAQGKRPVKYRPSRHSFIYKLVELGLEAYKKDSAAVNQAIIYGS